MSRAYLDTDSDIAALATPRGQGARAVIRLAGPGCVERLAGAFSRPDVLRGLPGFSAAYGRVLAADGRAVDEVVALVSRAPASYTGQDGVDLLCHGGVATVEAVIAALDARGFRRALPGEFTFRAFYNGKMDLAKAEAVGELVAARTSEARADAFSRLSGGLSRELSAVRDRLLRAAAALALRLDYGEDEAPADEASELGSLRAEVEGAREACLRLASSYAVGRALRDGAVVALAGRTNAGKSSLFNRLLKEERAIVSPAPGTTRDYLEAELDLGGLPVTVVDTAGVRQSDDPIEAEGVRRSRLVAGGADVVVYVVDAVAGLDPADDDFLAAHPLAVRAWNKVDAPGAREVPAGWLGLSAATGRGEAELVAAVRAAVLGSAALGSATLGSATLGAAAAGQPGSAAPLEPMARIEPMTRIGSARHRDALESAASCLSEALEALRSGEPADMAAVDVAAALESLGEITGETTSEDVLDALFSGFCVGK